jgi:adenylate cyclase
MAEDEAGTVRTLATYREEVSVLVPHHRGRVVDFTGDNFLAEFPTALDAVECAVEVQRVLAARNASLPEERRMEFRIGVHMGDVTVEGERIYGDGVNIAARLEGLADAGGVCISGTVYEQVEKKLTVQLDDLGDQTLKNISRPVHVYGIRLLLDEPESVARDQALPGMDDRTVPGFGGAPAVAVLAFDNLSGDPDQEYFADGIAEDLITRLSSTGLLPVIARNSSFVYKGQAIDVKRVGRELGVRYVVEGSVRKAGERVRISAQLIDAASGAHVWAERYDRELEDIFDVQDEITDAVAGSLNVALIRSEAVRTAREDPRSFDAYDAYLQGLWHMFKATREDNARARAFFQRAAELDPEGSRAFSGLASTHYSDIFFRWTDSPARSLDDMFREAHQCVKLDNSDALGHTWLAWGYSLKGQGDQAIAAADLAVRLAPSAPWAHLALGVFLSAGHDPAEGILHIEKAMRLSPRDPSLPFQLSAIAGGHFAARRYEEAVEWARRSLQQKPDLWTARGALASSLAHLGRMDEARNALAEMLRHSPEFSTDSVQMIFSFATPDFTGRWLEGLRKAGLKEE